MAERREETRDWLRRCVDGLVELQDLRNQGQLESEAAEAICERLDEYWPHLTAKQAELAGMASADLLMRSGEELPRPPLAMDEEAVRARFQQVWEASDWLGALAILRTKPGFIPDGKLA